MGQSNTLKQDKITLGLCVVCNPEDTQVWIGAVDTKQYEANVAAMGP